MYLKSIEVQGFKSFANKVNFEFHPGITAIVGPNGSGKSNVADAVRWVLGEQSAKQLRGGSMQDVIFAGTETRKPQSFASVAITLDNSDHCLDIDYDEVTVTRRLYRSGESEYLINHSPVRLRDIHELFYDTGIGQEGYSIIGQGQIDRILSGKAEERRELFDEAAGIVKFKRRKSATLKKLDEEQQNLVRINDILSELTRQLDPLKKQSDTARIYLDKRENLKKMEVSAYLAEETYAKTQLQEIGGKAEITGSDLQQAQEELAQTGEEYNALETELTSLDQKIDELKEAVSGHNLMRQKLTSQIEILNEQIQAVRRTSETNAARKNSITTEREARVAEKEAQKQALTDTETKAKEQKQREETLESQAAALAKQLDAVTQKIDRAQNDVIRMLDSRASVKGQGQHFATMLEQMNIRKAEEDSRILRLKEEEDAAGQTVEALTAALKEVADELEKRRDRTAQTEAEEKSLSEKLGDLGKKADALQMTYHRDASRYQSLRAMSERYEGYGNAIRKLMSLKESNPGIRGVVADLIDVPEQYETAIETALGGSIRNIVTDNENTAKYLIEYLKRNRLGRATFLPLTGLRRRTFDNTRALSEKGVIGTASSLVSCDAEYEGLKEYLLGRTLVVETVDEAIRIGRAYHHSLSMVTLQGESFSPGGAITGGAFRNTENLLGRKRELEELKASVKKNEKAITDLKEQTDAIRTKRNMLRDTLNRESEEMHSWMLKLNTTQLSRKQAEEKLSLARVNRQGVEKEREKILRQIAEAEEQNRKIREQLAHAESEESKIREESDALTEESAVLSEQHAAAQKELESCRVEMAAASEKTAYLTSDIRRIESDLQRLDTEEQSLADSERENAAKIRRKEEQIREVQEEITGTEKKAEDCSARQSALSEKRRTMSDRHREFFDKRDEISGRISRLEREKDRLDAQREKIEEALDSAASHLWEEYEMTPSEARAAGGDDTTDRRERRRQIAKLREEIRQLGPVNVNAIEEYQELSKRHTFLSSQHEDLVKSEQTLQGIIAELDRGMRRQFEEKFSLIQKEFDKAFQDLFGGGHGTLELDENMDILEAGITITAHPPGKKLQNMMMLSGGEKALTAIALLFAIQNLKPSPFCLLDEIEAALDDNNVARFANYLHNLTKNTQFIVITHRRGTMAAADRLYGITMQEKGVSTLISVSLIENELS